MKKMARELLLLVCLSVPTTMFAETTNYKNAICELNNPLHILVNKEYAVTKDYKPDNLVIPKVKFASPGNIPKNYLQEPAARALENLFNGAKKNNITLVAVSGYRSYDYQNNLYQNAVRKYGNSQKGNAKPNESEHRIGLAMDVNSVDQSFANTREGKWLAKNAHKYGWIIRYPKGKTNITGYIYEPWHIRYVGVELATYCYENDKTLEELENCCIDTMKVEVSGHKYTDHEVVHGSKCKEGCIDKVINSFEESFKSLNDKIN